MQNGVTSLNIRFAFILISFNVVPALGNVVSEQGTQAPHIAAKPENAEAHLQVVDFSGTGTLTEKTASMSLRMPDGPILTFHLVEESGSTALPHLEMAWIGATSDKETWAAILQRGRSYRGLVLSESNVYEVRVDNSIPEVEFLSGVGLSRCGSRVLHDEGYIAGAGGCNDPSAYIPAQGPISIDVLQLFTPEACEAANGSICQTSEDELEIRTFMDLSLTAANIAFLHSGAPVFLRSVYSGSVLEYEEALHKDPARAHFRSSQEIAELRQDYSADLVALFVSDLADDEGPLCGVAAKVMGRPDVGLQYQGEGFQLTVVRSAQRPECELDRFTYLHEHGHNLGLRHDPVDDTQPPELGSFCFSFGNYVSDPVEGFRTVMATSAACGEPPFGDDSYCPRVGLFSDPDLVHSPSGIPTGVLERDNVRVLELTAPIVAKFRAENDHFRNAKTFTTQSGAVTGTNYFSGREDGEPLHGANPGGPTVWWEWVAPSSGTLNLTTAGSTFDTILAVYTGLSIDSLSWVAAGDNPGSSETISFGVSGGTSYKIVVDGANLDTGEIQLSWDFALGNSDLRVILTDVPDPVSLGENVELTATATNLGPDSATNVQFSFELPTELSFDSSSHPGACQISGTTILCDFPSLAVSDSQDVTITAEAVSVGIATTSVEVRADEERPIYSPGVATEATSIEVPDTPTCGTFGLSPTIRSTTAGGRWNRTSTWLSERVPGAADVVEINGPVSFRYEPEIFGLVIGSAGSLSRGSQPTGAAILHVAGNFINNSSIEPVGSSSFSIAVNGNAWNTGLFQGGGSVSVSGCIANSGAWEYPSTSLTQDGPRSILGSPLGSANVYVEGLVKLENSTEFDYTLWLRSGHLEIPTGVTVSATLVREGTADLIGDGALHVGTVYGPIRGSIRELRIDRRGLLKDEIFLPLVILSASETEISAGNDAVTISGNVISLPGAVLKPRDFGSTLTIGGRLTHGGETVCKSFTAGCAGLTISVTGDIINTGDFDSRINVIALSSIFNNGSWRGRLELAGNQGRVLAGQSQLSSSIEVTGDFELLNSPDISGALTVPGRLTINSPNSLSVSSTSFVYGSIDGTGSLHTDHVQRGLRGSIREVRVSGGGRIAGNLDIPLLVFDGGTIIIKDEATLSGSLEVLPGTTWQGERSSTFTVNGPVLNSGSIQADFGSSNSYVFNLFLNSTLHNTGSVQSTGLLFVHSYADLTNDGIWSPRETILDGTANRVIGGVNGLGSRTRLAGDFELLGGGSFDLLEISSGGRLGLNSPNTVSVRGLKGAGTLDGNGSLEVGLGGYQGSLSGTFSGTRFGNDGRLDGSLDLPLVTFFSEAGRVDALTISGDVVVESGASIENYPGSQPGSLVVGGSLTNYGVVRSNPDVSSDLDAAVGGRFENQGQVLGRANLVLAGDIFNQGIRTGPGRNFLTWEEVPNSTYEIAFSENLVSWSTPVGLSTNLYDVSGPLSSSFYWRVRGVDAQGVPQTWGTPRSMNEGIVQVISPTASADYRPGSLETLEWTTPFPDSDIVVLAMKRDSVPPDVTEPDGVNWVRFSSETQNDGIEEIQIPTGVALAADWRFYVRHAGTDSFGGTDFVFTVLPPRADLETSTADSPDPVAAGAAVVYTVSLTNHGPSDAADVVVASVLPNGVTLGLPPIQWTVYLGGLLRSEGLPFKLHRAQVPQRRVTPLAIVEDFQVLEDRRSRLPARQPAGAVDQLLFESRKEAFRDGIVPAVTATTHAASDPGSR